jgi:uncharacterized protein (TIGR02246 family)
LVAPGRIIGSLLIARWGKEENDPGLPQSLYHARLLNKSKKENHSMSRHFNFFGVAIVVLTLACIQLGHAQTSQDSKSDEAAIRQVVQQVQDGWNAKSGQAFAAPFAADADYVVVSGMKLKGREVIERGHTGIFKTIYKDSHNVGTVQSIRFLRPDVAVVHVEWNLEFRSSDQTEKARALNTMVMTKDSGKWSIAAFQNTPVQPPGR